MSSHLAFEAFLTFCVGFLLFLFITGCAAPNSNYWGSLARGVQQEHKP